MGLPACACLTASQPPPPPPRLSTTQHLPFLYSRLRSRRRRWSPQPRPARGRIGWLAPKGSTCTDAPPARSRAAAPPPSSRSSSAQAPRAPALLPQTRLTAVPSLTTAGAGWAPCAAAGAASAMLPAATAATAATHWRPSSGSSTGLPGSSARLQNIQCTAFGELGGQSGPALASGARSRLVPLSCLKSLTR